MYTSKSARGFFDPMIHGPLTIVVADPAWIRPKKQIVLAPGESFAFDGATVTNRNDQPENFTVPDLDAVAPTQEVGNPDTHIPADAVEITFEEWQALLDGQSAGQMIEWGDDGFPFLTDYPPAPPPTTEQVEALRLQAYADPLTGSDRHFAEATRLTVAGDTAGADAATVAGQIRYEEIRVELPWPEDDTQPTRKSKAKK